MYIQWTPSNLDIDQTEGSVCTSMRSPFNELNRLQEAALEEREGLSFQDVNSAVFHIYIIYIYILYIYIYYI